MSQVGFPDDAPVDERDEQLVAYLDGELPSNELRALEQRLGSDAALRARLRELQNGWELLDQLPLASSSNTLLETTIRMAAIDGSMGVRGSAAKVTRRKLPPFAWLAMATAGCFFIGFAVMRVRERLNFQSQLRDLPIAMHLDAYLHASDLDLMETLSQMPAWQGANEMADQLGKWDVNLAHRIDDVESHQRSEMLQKFPVNDQKLVASAWERFENISPQQRQAARDVAAQVASRPDATALLKTMDRFAVWRESWRAEDRDRFNTGKDREEFLRNALSQTKQRWTQDSASKLSESDVEAIYQALRQIARLRLRAIYEDAADDVKPMIESFGSSRQAIEPEAEAYFLRRMFDDAYRGPQRRDYDPGMPPPGPPGPPPSFGPGGGPASILALRNITERLRGPLHDDELVMLHTVLPKKWADLVDTMAANNGDRDGTLRTIADESLKRMQWNRSGQTTVERYIRAEDREEMDLLPADQLLRRVNGNGWGNGFGRR